MAFEVKFGKSDKRINSTKIPTLTESATCVLKSGTSVERPTFILQSVSPFDWNVAYCATFGRYYFVKNITLMPSDFLEIELHEDVLMTYASDIKSVRGLVKRQEKLYSDYIVDHKMLTQVQRKVSKVNVGTVGTTNGSIILTVTN